MTTQVSEGLERLASRLALLTSEDGEAENAGRAAGQLARRLGLSGGQLKAIFLAGVQAGGSPLEAREAAPDAEAVTRAEQEAQHLRGLLDRTDAELHAAQRRAVVLQDENEALREQLDRSRTTGAVLRVAGAVVVAAALAGGGLAWCGPAWRMREAAPPPGSLLLRQAVAGSAGVTLFGAPDQAAPALVHLPPGASLPVRRLLWHGLSQWVETESAGQTAYAPAIQVDLR